MTGNKGMNQLDAIWAPFDTPIARDMFADPYIEAIKGIKIKYVDGSAPALAYAIGQHVAALLKDNAHLRETIAKQAETE